MSLKDRYSRRGQHSSMPYRLIFLNQPHINRKSFPGSNRISTAKYNLATFFPKFLYEQFSKYANVFFLFSACIQQIPQVSPTSPWATLVPLCVVLSATACKEVFEDWKRYASDSEVNARLCKALVGNRSAQVPWYSLTVGDIVRVSSGQPFPADLVLISSSEPEGLCYIETSNLDGETNLKIKQARVETADILTPERAANLSGNLKSELPNNSLYTYEGVLTLDGAPGPKEIPIDPAQILLRGAMLRNTSWIYGLVIFTGHETKLMRNARYVSLV